MRMHIRTSLSIVIVTSALVMTGGCGNEPDDYTNRDRQIRQNAIKPLNRISSDGKAIPDDHTGRPAGEANATTNRINHDQLAHIAENVPGVKTAIAVMNDTDVLVGLETDHNTGNKRIIEKRVMSALTWQYPEYRYHITASDELRERIKSVSVRQNKGYRAYMRNQDIGILADAIDVSSIRP
ncbi:YhcN/YlaJ family sporulation lipoprotein [Paenibacillus sp. NPDC057967]|uniref:YhcN/YlaJ family sporulation lipoprotein n=1 Tax=Paenibacillus sp. NPDC057967 TaxID=3346293 RepID=UPI0036DD9364